MSAIQPPLPCLPCLTRKLSTERGPRSIDNARQACLNLWVEASSCWSASSGVSLPSSLPLSLPDET